MLQFGIFAAFVVLHCQLTSACFRKSEWTNDEIESFEFTMDEFFIRCVSPNGLVSCLESDNCPRESIQRPPYVFPSIQGCIGATVYGVCVNSNEARFRCVPDTEGCRDDENLRLGWYPSNEQCVESYQRYEGRWIRCSAYDTMICSETQCPREYTWINRLNAVAQQRQLMARDTGLYDTQEDCMDQLYVS